MKNQDNWLMKKLVYARIFLAGGLLLAVAGAAMEIGKIQIGFDARLITGLGILLIGMGFSSWLRYFSARRDPETARRSFNAKMDERLITIRNNAGNRGFWVALTFTYTLLIWESLSSDNRLPALSDNLRWIWLAAATVIPFLVYLFSVFYDDARS